MKELKPYLNLAESYKADVEVYRCEGEFGSVHGVPAETIHKMKERFVDYPGEIRVHRSKQYDRRRKSRSCSSL